MNGAEKPAVRVRVNPAALRAAGLSTQDVYTTIRNNNVNGPVGGFSGPRAPKRWSSTARSPRPKTTPASC